MAKKARKRSPQDATLRNIRALKERVARLERQMQYLWQIARSWQKVYGL